MIGEVLTRRRAAGRAWTPGFNRFALANSLSAAGDALVTVSLAGSLFFSLSPQASRQQALIYLLITMVPFAVLAPFIGPAIDRFRGGDRWVAATLFALRAVFAVALAFTLFQLTFYLFALGVLIASKASGVVKQALVPGLVGGPAELVAANARLARLTTLVGGAGGAAGAVLGVVASPTASLAVASAAFVAAGAFASRLPPVTTADLALDPSAVEQREYEAVHSAVLASTSWAFTVMRIAVGFFVFGTAFALRRTSEPPWMYGAAAVAYGAGVYAGNTFAPLLKLRYREDRLIVGSIIALAVVAAFGALGPSRYLVLTFAVVLGAAIGVGRQAFDALAQARAPAEARGRTFARFETWFQLGWVAGAVLATAVGIPVRYSLAIVAVGMVLTAWFYRRAVATARRASSDPFDAADVVRRRLDSAAAWRERGRTRIAVAELGSVVDLLRTVGADVGGPVVACVERLRAAAVAGAPIDHEHVDWALEAVGLVVADLETLGQPASATDVEVTVSPADRSSNETTSRDQSAAER